MTTPEDIEDDGFITVYPSVKPSVNIEVSDDYITLKSSPLVIRVASIDSDDVTI